MSDFELRTLRTLSKFKEPATPAQIYEKLEGRKGQAEFGKMHETLRRMARLGLAEVDEHYTSEGRRSFYSITVGGIAEIERSKK